jgi:hypothetical protein
MCKATIKRVADRMRATIRWYFGFAIVVITVAAATLVAVNLPIVQRLLGTNNLQGTLVGALFGAFAGLPLKEIQDRRNKVLLLDLLIDEYEHVSSLPDQSALESLEQRCRQITDKILGG